MYISSLVYVFIVDNCFEWYVKQSSCCRVMEVSNITLAMLDEVTEGPGFSTKVICGTKYILPPHVHYICDDVSNILDYTSDEKFDFIIMDPPWQNKHVKRKKSVNGSQQG